MKWGSIGFDFEDKAPKKRTYHKKSKKKQHKRSTRKESSIYDNDYGIDMNNSMMRSGTQSERRKARKKAPKGSRMIGMSGDGSAIMSYDGGMGIDMDIGKDSILNTDISKTKIDSEFDMNFGDTGFGIKQKDLNKKKGGGRYKDLDDKPLNETTFKTPFADITTMEIPISDSEGNPLRNSKGRLVTQKVTRYSNVNPAFSLIGSGIQKLNKKIKADIQKDKDREQAEELFESAVRHYARPNNPNEKYGVQLTDRDGVTKTLYYGTKERAELALRRARSQGFTAIKV